MHSTTIDKFSGVCFVLLQSFGRLDLEGLVDFLDLKKIFYREHLNDKTCTFI